MGRTENSSRHQQPPVNIGHVNIIPMGSHNPWTCGYSPQTDDYLDYGPWCGMTLAEWEELPVRVKKVGNPHVNEVYYTFFLGKPETIGRYQDSGMSYLPYGFTKLSSEDQARFCEIGKSCFTYLLSEHSKELQAGRMEKEYFDTTSRKISGLQDEIDHFKRLARLKRTLE